MNLALQSFWQAAQHMLESFLGRVPALVLSIIVFLLFYLLSRFVARTIRRAVSRERQNLAVVFARLTAGGTVLFGFLVAVSVVAPSFRAGDLIKVLGIGGVAIGFAFQNILQNFLAGLLLLWAEPFRVGDEINVDAYEGKVEEIQARATIIRTYDERLVVIPNADLFTHSVIVNTALELRRWQYDVVTNSVQRLRELKARLVEAVAKVPGVLSEPAPQALVVEVSSESAKLRVVWCTHENREQEMLASYDRVLTSILESLPASASSARATPAA